MEWETKEEVLELLDKVQCFIWEHKDLILKGKSTYDGAHELWGTCYPAAWFLHELLWEELKIVSEVRRKKFNEHGNHTFVVINGEVYDPTADQIPDGWDYFPNVKSSQMIAHTKMPHKTTRKLLELWKN